MAKSNPIYQFKIQLFDINPPIWCRIQVVSTYTFWDLHVAIQDAMGWLDYHLHGFWINDPDAGDTKEIGIPDEDVFVDERPCLPGWETPMSSYFHRESDRAEYECDFGDGWVHEVHLEKILERISKTKYPICVAGARACPPEDCGGVLGYDELLRTIVDPSHEEHSTTMQWLGGAYDADAFDPKRVRFANLKRRWNKAFLGS